MFRNFPATIVLIVLNVIVFLLTWADAGTFDNPAWTNSLVRLGAQFNPFTLGGEWYRIFSHMFLHGHTVHLLVNMLALFSAGRDVESAIGTKKFVWLYFISGIGAALASLYWSMFTVGVGASGAIFGIFGFSVAISILHGRREGRPIAPIVINLLVFIFINVAVGEAFHADHAAHFGGLITGALLAVCSYYFHSYISNIKVEYAFILVMVAIFFLLPRFQVHYYDFFKQIIRAEREGKQIAGSKLTDQQFLDRLAFNNAQWDSAKVILARHSDLPEKLRSDALTLTKYANFRKIENDYRIRMIKDETYILLDSIGVVQDSIRKYLTLEHPVPVNFDNQQEPEQNGQPEHEEEQKQMVRVWYDSDWVEIAHPGPYYRIGYRDSSNLWQGRVDDFYADGSIQMKGSYENDERDGVFLYYSHHNTYTSAGRYVKNRSVGKWQTFHNNGKLKEEIIYGDRVFYKNIWDSTGAQLVRDGKGKVTELYPDNSPKS
jgi:membrane associated rhomboid family serine protease